MVGKECGGRSVLSRCEQQEVDVHVMPLRRLHLRGQPTRHTQRRTRTKQQAGSEPQPKHVLVRCVLCVGDEAVLKVGGWCRALHTQGAILGPGHCTRLVLYAHDAVFVDPHKCLLSNHQRLHP